MIIDGNYEFECEIIDQELILNAIKAGNGYFEMVIHHFKKIFQSIVDYAYENKTETYENFYHL